ncbi:MAG: outer membrane protein assembly factor BamE [Deltaproteobacteria bacterium]|nr:outer membrane protein assembly factor BamE [Deltaproteobacteria bacterium]
MNPAQSSSLLHLVLALVLAVALLASQGCASSGNPKVADFNPSTQVEYGKTTKQEIQAMLGEPNGKSFGMNGREIWIYTYARAQAKPATFIPLVGLFAGGMDTSGKNLTFAFDENGVLQKQGSGEVQVQGGSGITR